MGLMITYDHEGDAISVAFVVLTSGCVARTRRIDDDRLVDYDAEGNVIALELLNVSAGVDLDGVPRRNDVAAALRSLSTLATA